MSSETTPQLMITGIREQARDIRSFDLVPRDGSAVVFKPGQVAVLHVQQEDPAYFAFASSPEDPDLEILVKRTIGASVALFQMNEGDMVQLMGVAGNGFDLEAQAGRDL